MHLNVIYILKNIKKVLLINMEEHVMVYSLYPSMPFSVATAASQGHFIQVTLQAVHLLNVMNEDCFYKKEKKWMFSSVVKVIKA